MSPSSLTVADYVPPVLVFLLRVSFQLALAPYPWVYGNELFPLDMRSYLCAFTSSLEPVQVRLMVYKHNHDMCSVSRGLNALAAGQARSVFAGMRVVVFLGWGLPGAG